MHGRVSALCRKKCRADSATTLRFVQASYRDRKAEPAGTAEVMSGKPHGGQHMPFLEAIKTLVANPQYMLQCLCYGSCVLPQNALASILVTNSLETQGKGSVLVTNSLETQGKSSVHGLAVSGINPC